jgi:hypothetical protein
MGVVIRLRQARDDSNSSLLDRNVFVTIAFERTMIVFTSRHSYKKP